tara:strand:- start:5551 stop:5688 length:138 start_codon:yes stop_codon:yes gene_type:complete
MSNSKPIPHPPPQNKGHKREKQGGIGYEVTKVRGDTKTHKIPNLT